MVDLVRTGRSPEELAREFGPTTQSFCAGVARADKADGGREAMPPGLATAERDELLRLRREVKQLRIGRAKMSKARRGFALETLVLPSGKSGS